MLHKNISELLEHNHGYASVMHWHGIDAFSYLQFTLDEVCKIKNIDGKNMELALLKVEFKSNNPDIEKLKLYAPSRLCNYLLNNHHHYAQLMLPVIEHHIQQAQIKLSDSYPQLHLLANIFDTFKTDFLKHIAYENDKVFPYIKKLERYTIAFNNSMLVQVKDFSIKDFIMKHHHDDDEMRNIRVLLKNYATDKRDALAYKVLMDELKSFEIDLKGHSQIEEEILVPMAYRMEQKLYKKLDDLVKLN
ncbi:MAG: hemerythrin domain-containing protein [Bacteroidia bacterium]|nr:hemerythrin domain-containing protein [Bacteroidia bacterium]